MTTRWYKRGANQADLAVLHPGVPEWMKKQLLAWVTSVTQESYLDEWANRRMRPNVSILMDYETAVRRPESLVSVFRDFGVSSLFTRMGQDEFLDFVDFLVFTVQQQPNSAQVLRMLEVLLSDGGSEWSVGTRDGFASLEKRVPEGVVAAVDEVVALSGEAGRLLAESWHAAFGKSPDAEEAYEKAIKAVEEAGARMVSPNNSKTTLGTMIRDMKAQKDWKLDLSAQDADVPVKMAEALWIGQESRHGGNGYRKPSRTEAEAAVLLAVPLVQWFTSGALARRN